MQEAKAEYFDSLILAGGFGKRLSPLTDTIPKPMLPIAGRSAFERNLDLLRKCGFLHTAVTTMYLPEKVECVKRDFGTVKYYRESTPLGSAGALAKLKSQLSDCVIVMSGDAMCDFDLSKAKEDFIASGCDAGIILTRTSDAGEFGSVCVKDGIITAFCEKPSVRDTMSDLVNTGIYFLTKNAVSLIPDGRFFDFARDLFPEMMRRGMKIAGVVPDGHWFDIGSFGELHRCSMWVSNGENCIGSRVSIHPNARIEYSVIFDGCTVGNSVLRGAIVGEGAVIGNDCVIPSGCVIGSGAELRDGAQLAPGSVVGTGETVVGDSFVDYFKSPKCQLCFEDDYIVADRDDDGFFVRLGRLLGGDGNIVAFAEGGRLTLPYACELACGVSESGSSCTVISGGNVAAASFSALERGEKTAFIRQNADCTEVRLFSENGMPFSREALRKLDSKVSKRASKAGSVFLLPHGAVIKRFLLGLRTGRCIPKKMNIDIGRGSEFLRECARELGIGPDEGGAIYRLEDNGEKASAILPDGREVPYWQLLAMCCIEGGNRGILLPRDTPNTVESILRRHSIDVGFYSDSDSDERTLAGSERLPRDGVMLAMTSAWLCEKNKKTLSEMLESIPPFSVTTRIVFADRDRMSSIISRLREENGGERSVGFDFGEGHVSVYASAGGRFRLIAEALDTETAEEISLRAENELKKRISG